MATSRSSKPIVLVPGAELLDIQPPPFLLPGLVRERTLTMVAAAPFSGKSALLTAVAVAISSGAGLMFDAPKRSGSVLFLALDGPRWDYAGLERKICAGLGLDVSGDRGDPMHPLYDLHYCFDRQIRAAVRQKDSTVRSPRWERLIAEAGTTWDLSTGEKDEGLPDLIIVDCLRKVHTGPENDDEHMGVVMDAFQWLADQGPAVVVAHHTGKQTEGKAKVYHARGSSVISGSVDSILDLTPNPNSTDHDVRVRARWTKGRGGDLPPRWSYTMSWNEEQLTFERSTRGREAKNYGAVRDCLPETIEQIAAKTGLSRATVYRRLQALGAKRRDDKKFELPSQNSGST